MSVCTNIAKKFGVVALALATITGTIASTTASADARPFGHRHHHHRGHGWVGPAIVGGLALGALTASRYRECWVEPREVVNRRGHVVVRNVRVCN